MNERFIYKSYIKSIEKRNISWNKNGAIVDAIWLLPSMSKHGQKFTSFEMKHKWKFIQYVDNWYSLNKTYN